MLRSHVRRVLLELSSQGNRAIDVRFLRSSRAFGGLENHLADLLQSVHASHGIRGCNEAELLSPDDLGSVCREIYACGEAQRCRPPGGRLYPAPPHGRGEGTIEILLVGYNPQAGSYSDTVLPSYEEWIEEGRSGIERGFARNNAWSQKIRSLLPPGTSAAALMNTRLWKWPSNKKAGAPVEMVELCTRLHLAREVAAISPRVILTYDKDAANWIRGNVHGSVEPCPSEVPSREAIGWSRNAIVAYHACAVVLCKGTQARYSTATRSWAQSVIASVLEK